MGLCASGLGCGGPAEREAPLRIAHESGVLSFDPSRFPESATRSILGNFYEGLVAFDGHNALVPALAESWLTSDGRTWELHIRKGVRFHDGSPLTAGDVKACLDWARTDVSSDFKGYLSAITAVEAHGDALTVRSSRPDPLLLNRLAFVFIVPGSMVGKPFERPVGTGPYRFVGWQRGEYLDAAAFEDYWGGPPSIERVRFVTVPGAQAEQALREGRADVLRWLPTEAVAQLPSMGGFRVASEDGVAAYYLWMNPWPVGASDPSPFSDRRVRQALSLAVDREALVQALRGHATPLNQLVHKGVFGHVPDLPRLPRNRKAARRLLAEAGYPDGFGTTLAHRTETGLGAVAEALGDALGEVGIEVELQPMEWHALLDAAWHEPRLPLFIAAWQSDEGDAWGFLRNCIYTRDEARTHGAYNPGYSDAEMDRLIERGDIIFDARERLAHYRTLTRYVLEEMPLVPLFARRDLYAVSPRVRWTPRIDGNLLAAEMSWDPAEPR